jgi:hypothetical protein
MTTLATPEALAAMRGVTYDPTDLTQVLALEAASDAVRTYCNQQFDYVADDEVALDGTNREALLLPELPVHAVASVIEDDVVLNATDYVLSSAGILRRVDTVWSWGWGNVEVTYTHGYVLPEDDAWTLPADLQLVVLQIAARIHATAGGAVVAAGAVTQETIGSYSVSYGGDGESSSSGAAATTVLPLEMAVLQLYRQRRLA